MNDRASNLPHFLRVVRSVAGSRGARALALPLATSAAMGLAAPGCGSGGVAGEIALPSSSSSGAGGGSTSTASSSSGHLVGLPPLTTSSNSSSSGHVVGVPPLSSSSGGTGGQPSSSSGGAGGAPADGGPDAH